MAMTRSPESRRRGARLWPTMPAPPASTTFIVGDPRARPTGAPGLPWAPTTIHGSMGGQRRAAVSLAIGLVAGGCAWMLRTAPVHLEPGRGGWARGVRGAHADGRLGATTVVVLPGIARRAPASLVLEAEGGPANLAVTMDGAPPAWF